jgi:hypothetical protein
MHPAELFQSGSVGWLDLIGRHFRKTAWLNPEEERFWRGTAETIRRIYPMYRLTLDGLSKAVVHLTDRLARRA